MHSSHSCQVLHVSSSIFIHVIHSWQFIPFNSFISISSFQFQFLRFNSFNLTPSCQLIHVNAFMSIPSLQEIQFNSCISSHLCQFSRFNSWVSIPSFQVIHFNGFMSIQSFHAFHFLSIYFFPTHHEFLEAMSLFEASAPANAGHYLVSIHKLFWCEQKRYRVMTHPHM